MIGVTTGTGGALQHLCDISAGGTLVPSPLSPTGLDPQAAILSTLLPYLGDWLPSPLHAVHAPLGQLHHHWKGG